MQKGGRLLLARALPGRAEGRRLEELDLGGGEVLRAEQFVFACGPWLPRVFPALLGARIATPRRDVFYFGPPPGDARFADGCLPAFSEDGFYGFPDLDARGIKICPTGEPTAFDPDTDERLVSPFQLKRARDYLARRLPALAGQPVVETRVCQLENTADEHFLIDRHPDFDNVWIAGGGSGHGFKHGPVLGEYVAGRVLDDHRDAEYDALFRLR